MAGQESREVFCSFPPPLFLLEFWTKFLSSGAKATAQIPALASINKASPYYFLTLKTPKMYSRQRTVTFHLLFYPLKHKKKLCWGKEIEASMLIPSPRAVLGSALLWSASVERFQSCVILSLCARVRGKWLTHLDGAGIEHLP